jgi:hypothetical protein
MFTGPSIPAASGPIASNGATIGYTQSAPAARYALPRSAASAMSPLPARKTSTRAFRTSSGAAARTSRMISICSATGNKEPSRESSRFMPAAPAASAAAAVYGGSP